MRQRRDRGMANLDPWAATTAVTQMTGRLLQRQERRSLTGHLSTGACLLASALACAALMGACKEVNSDGVSDVRINEILASNRGVVLDGEGRSPDWIELYNAGKTDVDMEDWKLKHGNSTWNFPAGTTIPVGGYLVVFATGLGGKGADSATDPSELHTNFKLSASCNGLSLLQPGGSPVSVIGPQMPRQIANVSFGIAGEPGAAGARVDARSSAPFTFLATPTPGAANSEPLPSGPFIYSISNPAPGSQPTPGTDLVLNITLEPNLNAINDGKVVLSYIINWGKEQEIAAQKVAVGPGRLVTFTATIPHTAFSAGDMIRWRSRAEDAAGYRSVFPAPSDAEENEAASKLTRYFGTVIAPAPEDIVTEAVPILEWFSPDPAAATTVDGAYGQVIFFNGQLYDNLYVRRRGVTALSWPKPKLKFELSDRQKFKYAEDMPGVGEFGLQSFWYELGERSYMKETLALQFMRDAGVVAPNSFHLHVRLNGKFYGLFAFIETPDADYLKRYGLPPSGPLFKSVSGELSNLRWDLPVKEMPSFWEKENRQREANDWSLLANLSRGLAGGGPVPRSKYVFDALNLPQVINNIAAQTIVNNMDRCTKNYFMYMHPQTREWYMLPWDMDGSFGQDNGLGGRPGPNYCVLACEQWNSPLYCDSEHPQDVMRTTPWGSVSVTLSGSYEGPAVRKGPSGPGSRKSRQLLETPPGRLLLQSPPPAASTETSRPRRRSASSTAGPATSASPMYAAGPNITKFPVPRGWEDPDRSTLGQTSPNGPLGTYNHLNDAILDVNATRTMYMRRLRTLADRYLAGGRLAQFANETYIRIKPLADLDAKAWNSGISIDRGYKQIITEFLPVRQEQLLGSLYGPNGRRPLLPETQPPQVGIKLARYFAEVGAPTAAFVELSNPNTLAVDMSGWALQGPVSYSFPQGTVIAGGGRAFVAASASAFRERSQEPRGGMGFLVLSPLQLQGAGGAKSAALQLLDANGTTVHELRLGSSK